VLASMGNYVFDADALRESVTSDATLEGSKHDMGGDIVPAFVSQGLAGVYDYKDNDVPGSNDRDRGYWRDVGTMGSYFDAHMDLVAPLPVFSLYNTQWPIYTSYGPQPPAKIVEGDLGKPIKVFNSILSPACRVEAGAEVSNAVLLNGVRLGRGAVVRNAIIDKNVVIPDGVSVGVDPEADKAAGYVVEDGLTILSKGQKVADA
jgi:glucose-1-phosphate adenylyltransferase